MATEQECCYNAVSNITISCPRPYAYCNSPPTCDYAYYWSDVCGLEWWLWLSIVGGAILVVAIFINILVCICACSRGKKGDTVVVVGASANEVEPLLAKGALANTPVARPAPVPASDSINGDPNNASLPPKYVYGSATATTTTSFYAPRSAAAGTSNAADRIPPV